MKPVANKKYGLISASFDTETRHTQVQLFSRLISIIVLFAFTNKPLNSQSLDLMTYNIRYDNQDDGNDWWNYRKEELVKLIQYYQPVIFGIQEGLHSQVEYIDEHLTEYSYIGVGRDDGQQRGEYTALYYDSTTFSVLREETFWLSESPEKVSVGWDASMERICTYGHFIDKSSNLTYHVFNAHFDHRGPIARENSARLIIKKIKKLNINDDQIILMGDLNCLPDSPPILVCKAVLDDVPTKSIYGPVGTFNKFDPGFIPDRRIDYIFSKNVMIESYRHIDDRRANNLWPSDHLPVMLRIKTRIVD